jgi:histidinol-phosphate aminotransferase
LSKSSKIVKVHESSANFLLVIAKDAGQLYNELKEQGIIVRNRASEIPNALRITVGTAAENEQLLKNI